MAYAEAAELAALMGRGDTPFTAAEQARAELVLTLATGVIDEETGQSLTLATDTLTLDGNGGRRLLLPRWPVTAVAEVTIIEDDDTETDLAHGADFRWTSYGRLRRIGSCWPCREQSIDAVVTAGWDPFPDGVKAMCLRLARAGWDNPAGLESERLGDWAAKWSAPGMGLTTAEKRSLSMYRART